MANDMEYRVAELYPLLDIGKWFQYCGSSPEMNSKILEQVTGDSLPALYKKHLVGPLKMKNTLISDSGGGARTTAGDMAIFGQMLLNGGAYGALRFMMPDTIEQMLPNPLDVIGNMQGGGVGERGIGTTWVDDDRRNKILGDRTFHHGSATSSTLYVDPENDLVIAVIRDSVSPAYEQYRVRLLKTIVDQLADE